jgi:hypothetical protein
MMNRNIVSVLALLAGVAPRLAGQATTTPSFNAPYRAFAKHEFGATISFPQGADLALEGQYRFGYQNFDLGFRGGFIEPGGLGSSTVVLGAEGRGRMFTHTPDFPADGALIAGIGYLSDPGRVVLTGGLSLGRRIDPRDSQVSIVLYVEPALFITSGGGAGTDVAFAFGLGADFRLSRRFDARASIGLGDVEGIAFSAVWVR